MVRPLTGCPLHELASNPTTEIFNAVLRMQSTRLLTSRTTCLTGTPTWLPALPVAWLVWLQAWPLASSVMLVSGQSLLRFSWCAL